MKTISKLVVGAMVALALTSCSGTGTGENLNPITLSTPTVSDILQTRVKVSGKVTGDNIAKVECVCDTLPDATDKWNDAVVATTDVGGELYSCIIGASQGHELHPNTDYLFSMRVFDLDGNVVVKGFPDAIRTLPVETPVDTDWQWVQTKMAKTLKHVGHDEPAFGISIEEDMSRTWCPTHKILRGIPSTGELCFESHTLKATSPPNGGRLVVQFAYCDPSQEASLNEDAVKAAEDFNDLHGPCRDGELARAHADFIDLEFKRDYTLTP